MFSRNLPLATALIMFGILSILLSFDIISYDNEIIISYVLIYFGVHSFYHEMDINRKRTVIGIVSFFLGLVLFISNQYSLLSYTKIIYPSISFTLAIIFLYLHFQSGTGKSFLLAGLLLLFFSFFVIIFKRQFPLINIINSTIEILVTYWYLLAIVIGFEILINRKSY